jgi:hypothetical protein
MHGINVKILISTLTLTQNTNTFKAMNENCICVNDNLLAPQYEGRVREVAWLFDPRNQLVTRREKTSLRAVKSCSVVIALLEVISKRLIS